MRFLHPFIFALLTATVFSQAVTKQEVMSSVRKVADNVVKNTTYLYFDKGIGNLISDLQTHGYNKNVGPQNGYNE